jgi:hypothetical protein
VVVFQDDRTEVVGASLVAALSAIIGLLRIPINDDIPVYPADDETHRSHSSRFHIHVAGE